MATVLIVVCEIRAVVSGQVAAEDALVKSDVSFVRTARIG
jgi:hypothetical protein